MEQELGRRVVELIGVQGFHERQLVGHGLQMGQSVRYPRPRLAVLRELGLRAKHLGDALDKRKPLSFEERRRAELAVQLREVGLIIKQLQLRRGAGHVQEDDVFGLPGEMRHPGSQRVGGGYGSGSKPCSPTQQRRQRGRAKAGRTRTQEMPAREILVIGVAGFV